MSHKLKLLLPILVAGVILDQVTKLWIVQAIPVGGQMTVIPGFFNLVHVYNRGAAFGLFSGLSPLVARWFFLATTSIVVLVVGVLWWRTPERQWPMALGYSLILTGALGNFIDRFRLGEVIDFLDFYLGRYHWPAFNVADSLVVVGAGLLIVIIMRE